MRVNNMENRGDITILGIETDINGYYSFDTVKNRCLEDIK